MYKNLFSPMRIGNCEIPNRLVVTAMVTNYCTEDGFVTDRFIKYHEEKAKGGWGLIITEDYAVNEMAKGYSHIPGLYKDEQIEGSKKLTDAIHKYESKIFCQIYHPGRQSNQFVNGGKQPVAPSAIPCPWLKEIPRELTVEEILQIVEDFGDCALRAKKSGFDGVEVHLAHGYLLAEFMSPHTNKRVDEYGGCFSNRLRIVKEVYENVRSKVGDDFPIICRFSSRDGFMGGRTLMDSIELAQYLEALGFQALDISQGMYGDYNNLDNDTLRHGFTVLDADEIKQVVNIPVMPTNRITTAGLAEALISGGKADLIGMGRTSLADPHFPNKVKKGKLSSVRHCINCNLGCFGGILGPRGHVTCLVNPSVGREYELDFSKSNDPKKVFIAGGGPGGLQAAVTAAQKGHHVTVFEKKSQLGGQLLSAAYPPTKGEVAQFTAWLIQEVKNLNIALRLNTILTKELVDSEKPDVVIVATGGSPIIPPIKGITKPHVVLAEDVLLGKVSTGNKVVVCGGGEVGIETAAFEATKENGSVTVIEMMDHTHKNLRLNQLLDMYGVTVNINTKLSEIADSHVIVEQGPFKRVIEADTVILAFGYKPLNILADELKDTCQDVRVIAGANKTGNALDATIEGLDVAMSL
ncbi:oxidoreductase [Alkalibacter mobilis]|uniref:oxidoreductase n=1 Tax=Alkalibacter mobilis TaxID=2787712 RepID=UPI0018A0F050|nr:FAD-dependent oxidoreductase [Alkalibacter mobilis]MBF7097890.1 FAD-dependent oxidoreductase [Alkalibacter mobilis]